MLLAIKNNGIVGYSVKECAFNGDCLIDFIRSNLLNNNFVGLNDVLIMDNCRFHHQQDVKQFLFESNIYFLYLPAYSSQLNPIEEYFSHSKAKYKSLKTLSKTKADITDNVTGLITKEEMNFGGWFRCMRRWVERGAAR